MTVFLIMFLDNIVDLVPFSVMCGYPFRNSFRYSLKKTAAVTAALILGLSAVNAATGIYLNSIMPYNNSLYIAINAVFLCSLVP